MGRLHGEMKKGEESGMKGSREGDKFVPRVSV